MSSPPPPPPEGGPDAPRPLEPEYVPVSPLLPEDPPKIGAFWLDARLSAAAAGVAYIGHDPDDRPAIVLLLSEGAAADAAARDRLAGVINAMHIDTVLARGGHGQDWGRLGRKFQPEDGPVPPDEELVAPWAALAYDGSPAAAREAERVLDQVQLATVGPQGAPTGPDYRHYWIDRTRPGLSRLWPLPWPGRYDRAGWRTILVSWLLMMLLAALAVLIAILIFRNQPPQTPPPPTGGTGSPPPPSASPPPQSGSRPPQSQSPTPQSESPSPSASPSDGSPTSGSPSPTDGSPSGSPSESESESGEPSPSGSQTPQSPQPSGTQSGGSGSTPRSRL